MQFINYTYGVDVLGFPVTISHLVFNGQTPLNYHPATLVRMNIENGMNERNTNNTLNLLKTANLVNDYHELIHQFRLIQEKRSPLNAFRRKFVELRIRYLIAQGHITVNKNQ